MPVQFCFELPSECGENCEIVIVGDLFSVTPYIAHQSSLSSESIQKVAFILKRVYTTKIFFLFHNKHACRKKDGTTMAIPLTWTNCGGDGPPFTAPWPSLALNPLSY